MKSFLTRGKKPICKWGSIPDNVFFEGTVPEGYSLAVSPSGDLGYIVVDVDRHGKINGFENIPKHLINEFAGTFSYETKNNGAHYWFKYSGSKVLANKASNQGIDLRTNKGYVIYYPKNDVRDQLHLIRNSSNELNEWLEELFSYK